MTLTSNTEVVPVKIVGFDPTWSNFARGAVGPERGDLFTGLGDALATASRDEAAIVMVGPAGFYEACRLLATGVSDHRALRWVLCVAEISMEALQVAMRAGADDVIDIADSAETVRAVVDRLSARIAPHTGQMHPRDPGRIVVVGSPKAGAGTSTVAVNLACLLLDAGRSVAAVDADPTFGDLGFMLGMGTDGRGAPSAPPPDHVTPGVIEQALRRHPETGLLALLSRRPPTEVAQIPARMVIDVLSSLQQLVDDIIIDMPPLLASIYDVIEVADEVLMVTRPDILSVKNTLVALNLLDNAGLGTERVKVVVNFADVSDALPIRDIEARLRRPVVCSVPSSEPTMLSSTVQRPVSVSHPSDPAVRELATLAKLLDEDR